MTKKTEVKKSLRMLKILRILKECTDSEHTMTQKQINEKLRDTDGADYSMNTASGVNTLSQTIHDLIDEVNPKVLTWENEYKQVIKYSTDKRGRITGIYYEPEIKPDEVRFLADGIMRLGLDEYNEDKILDKLTELYRFDRSELAPIHSFTYADSSAVSDNIAVIREAIRRERQITFTFNVYDREGRLKPSAHKQPYKVNPYEIAVYGGNTYLIANTPHYDNVSVYRIDLMTDIEITDTVRRARNTINEFRDIGDMREFLSRHSGMTYGEPMTVTLKVHTDRYTLIHDLFGDNISYIKAVDSKHDMITVKTTEKSALDLAFTASDAVEILSPESLRRKFAEKLSELAEIYKQ